MVLTIRPVTAVNVASAGLLPYHCSIEPHRVVPACELQDDARPQGQKAGRAQNVQGQKCQTEAPEVTEEGLVGMHHHFCVASALNLQLTEVGCGHPSLALPLSRSESPSPSTLLLKGQN